MADINLLQTQIKDTTHASTTRTKIVVWLALIVLLSLVGGCTVLYFMTKSVQTQTAEIDTTNSQLQKQIDSQESSLRGAKAFQAKLSNIDLLLKHHVYVSHLFTELESFTYQRALFNSFDVNEEDGKVHMEGMVESYNSLGKLLLGLSTAPHFRNVRLITITPTTTTAAGFQFSIDMNAAPDVFNQK